MYNIIKITNGNAQPLHKCLPDFETAHDILSCMARSCMGRLNRWSLETGDAIYQIRNDYAEGK